MFNRDASLECTTACQSRGVRDPVIIYTSAAIYVDPRNYHGP